MSLTFVQSTNMGTTSCNFSGANTAHNLLVLGFWVYNLATPSIPSTYTDSVGNVYQLGYSQSITVGGFNSFVAIYYCNDCAAGTPTCAVPSGFSPAGANFSTCNEYSGSNTVTQPDGAGAIGTIGSGSDLNLTIPSTNGDLVTMFGFGHGGNVETGAGMTARTTSPAVAVYQDAAASGSTFAGKIVQFSSTIAAGVGLSFTTVQPLTISTTSPLPDGKHGVAYTDTFVAVGGSGTGYTWSVTAGGSSLTALGLSLSSAGVLSGATPVAGSASFTVQVEDSASNIVTKPFTVLIDSSLVISTTSPLPNGFSGVAYSTTLAGSGGSGTGYTWSITSGGSSLTALGLSMSSGGVITGASPTVGTASFTVELTDSDSNTVTKPFGLRIYAALSITTTSPLPAGYARNSYATALAATGGVGSPYTWSVTAGGTSLTALGLTLNSDGTLTGTSPSAGTASFTAQVEDSASNTASASFTLLIAAFAPGTPNQQLIGGPPYTFECLPEGRKIARVDILCPAYNVTASQPNFDEFSSNVSNPGSIAGYIVMEFDLSTFVHGIGISEMRSLIVISRPLFLGDDFGASAGDALPALVTNETTGQSVICGAAAIALNARAAIEHLVTPFVGVCGNSYKVRFLSPQKSTNAIGRYTLLFCNWDVQGALVYAGAM